MLGGTQTLKAAKIWALETQYPELWHRLLAEQPWLSSILKEELHDGFPVAPTMKPFDNAVSVRPALHNRSFYIKHELGSVLAVKGSEVANPELEEALRGGASFRARWSFAESMPLLEQKLPYAVHVPEAIEEATKTAAFLEHYVREFDEFPCFPIHLAVYQIPSDIANNYYTKLNPLISERARQLCALLGQDGLAVYIYFFPTLPIRLAHIVPHHGIFDTEAREHVLKAKYGFDPRLAVDRFFSLVGKMLSLGYFPLSMASFGIGYCTSAQNVTHNGGMVDSDSLTPFGQMKDDWEFTTTFLTTLGTLCIAAKVMLYSPLPFVRFEFPDPSTISMLLGEFVWDRIRREISICEASGVVIDARLRRLLAPPSYEKIVDQVSRMHPKRTDWVINNLGSAWTDNRGWD